MPLSTTHGTKAVAKSVVYMFVLSKREKEGDLRVLVFNWLQRGAVHWHLLLISGDNKSGLLHDWHSFIELSFCLPFLFFSFSFLIGRPEVGRWNISEPISLTLGGWTTWIPKDYGWEKKMGRTGKKTVGKCSKWSDDGTWQVRSIHYGHMWEQSIARWRKKKERIGGLNREEWKSLSEPKQNNTNSACPWSLSCLSAFSS